MYLNFCVLPVIYVIYLILRNHTLTMIATPSVDLTAASRVNQEKTESAWAKVKQYSLLSAGLFCTWLKLTTKLTMEFWPVIG